MPMLEFDEHATRQIQRLYSTPDVVEQREARTRTVRDHGHTTLALRPRRARCRT